MGEESACRGRWPRMGRAGTSCPLAGPLTRGPATFVLQLSRAEDQGGISSILLRINRTPGRPWLGFPLCQALGPSPLGKGEPGQGGRQRVLCHYPGSAELGRPTTSSGVPAPSSVQDGGVCGGCCGQTPPARKAWTPCSCCLWPPQHPSVPCSECWGLGAEAQLPHLPHQLVLAFS